MKEKKEKFVMKHYECPRAEFSPCPLNDVLTTSTLRCADSGEDVDRVNWTALI